MCYRLAPPIRPESLSTGIRIPRPSHEGPSELQHRFRIHMSASQLLHQELEDFPRLLPERDPPPPRRIPDSHVLRETGTDLAVEPSTDDQRQEGGPDHRLRHRAIGRVHPVEGVLALQLLEDQFNLPPTPVELGHLLRAQHLWTDVREVGGYFRVSSFHTATSRAARVSPRRRPPSARREKAISTSTSITSRWSFGRTSFHDLPSRSMARPRWTRRERIMVGFTGVWSRVRWNPPFSAMRANAWGL